MTTPANTYKIIDTKTKKQVGKDYTNRSRAHTRADKLDLEYGAVRYRVETIYADEVVK